MAALLVALVLPALILVLRALVVPLLLVLQALVVPLLVPVLAVVASVAALHCLFKNNLLPRSKLADNLLITHGIHWTSVFSVTGPTIAGLGCYKFSRN